MQLNKYVVTSPNGKLLLLEAPSKIEALKRLDGHAGFEDLDYKIKKVTCEISWYGQVFQYIEKENKDKK